MLMAKEDSIRDVIAFPKVKDASDLMTEAPTKVDQKQLDELGLAVSSRGRIKVYLMMKKIPPGYSCIEEYRMGFFLKLLIFW